MAHPNERVVTPYRLEGGAKGGPQVVNMQNRLPSTACPKLPMDWNQVTK